MKNKMYIMLLALLVGVNLHGYVDQLVVVFGQTNDQKREDMLNEKDVRRNLYWWDQNNPLFFKSESFQKDLDYYIAILTKHINVLEGKIIVEQSGLKSKAMGIGLLASIGSAISGGMCFSEPGKPQDPIIYAIVCIGLAVVAQNKFSKAYYYQEHVVMRLNRDKRILAILEKEKAAKYTNKLNNIVTEESVLKGIETFVGFINGVTKQNPV
jgi:hypothetical protein